MSGRLIISSKKGYCPWNSKNLARIRRDEKEHREAKEREQEKQADTASTLRLIALKRTRDDREIHQRHFSLFESEERASIDRSNQLQGSKSQVCETKVDFRNVGRTTAKEEMQPVGFACRHSKVGGHPLTNKIQKKCFYMKPHPDNEALGWKEVKRKQEMDPMRDFQSAQEVKKGPPKTVQSLKFDNEISRREKRLHKSYDNSSSSRDGFVERKKEDKERKKKKSRHREDCKHSRKRRKSCKSDKGKLNRSNHNNPCSTDSIEELRKKRAEREEQERHRQDAFLITAQNIGEKKTERFLQNKTS